MRFIRCLAQNMSTPAHQCLKCAVMEILVLFHIVNGLRYAPEYVPLHVRYRCPHRAAGELYPIFDHRFFRVTASPPPCMYNTVSSSALLVTAFK